MFQRFHEMRERREDGFTLIELLVVILIVAILAAVAIPVFLRQREKGYVDQSESALKNASTAVESYATANNGDVSGLAAESCVGTVMTACADLEAEGYNGTEGVTLTVVSADATGAYCLQATHASLPATHASKDMRLSSEVGAPEDGTC